MTTEQLTGHIFKKKSFLCIGLDTDQSKIPPHLLAFDDPIFEFNKQIIDSTHTYAVAYKPNTAFYEAYGSRGWDALTKTIAYIKKQYPELFTIADAKRADIGNTAAMYAQAFFTALQFDSVTVAPYMGKDSVEPFLAHQDKFAILLALTSNPGAADFQQLPSNGRLLYEEVIARSKTWNNSERLMYVVGATQASSLAQIRTMVPEHFLLVPGVGAQGGSLFDVCKYGITANVGLLINSSRQIIYASTGTDFAQKAALEAKKLQEEMAQILGIYFP